VDGGAGPQLLPPASTTCIIHVKISSSSSTAAAHATPHVDFKIVRRRLDMYGNVKTKEVSCWCYWCCNENIGGGVAVLVGDGSGGGGC
jgi:hypothetical protein